MVNGPKHCWKLNESNFTIFIDPYERNWGWKSYSKILGLFRNPLTADNKYYLLNRGKLLQHFQMQLSQKQNIILAIYLSNFEI